MKRISFALTTAQIQNQTKTVTRRLGWYKLKPGDRLQPIYKGMGLKKGEKQQLLNGPIEVVSVRLEPINAITQADVISEGFPSWTPETFITFLCKKHSVTPDTIVNRIEFKYVET
jgi:hypothetical protein